MLSGRRVEDLLKMVLEVLTPFLIGLVLWEVAFVTQILPSFVLPSPAAVWAAAVQQRDLLGRHFVVTGVQAAAGFALAALVGIPLGWAIISSRVLRRALYPPMVASQAIPKVALGPIFILWFGFGALPKVILALLVAFFPIAVGAAVGFSSLDAEWYLLARAYRLKRHQIFLKFQLPAALPGIFGGLKVGAALAVVGTVVGEFIGSDAGLAYLLLIANANRDIPMVFTCVVLLSLMGIALYGFVAALEAISLPWKDRDAGRMVLGGMA